MRLPKFYYNETWLANFWFCIGWKENEIVNYCKKRLKHELENISESDGKCIEIFNDSKHAILIWTRDKSDIPSLVHEVVHAAGWIMQKRGWTYDYDNDEPFTYLVQSIMKEALKK